MVTAAPNQDEAIVAIALNVLTGKVNPDQWQGLRRVDEEEAAVLNAYREVRRWGFGRMEVTVLHHQLDTLYAGNTYKRKDLIKDSQGT